MRIIRELWSYPFMVNAFRAGTIVGVVAGALGWFMVLRRQTFAGHTLAVVGFPGAAGAVLIGASPSLGYFGFCLIAALAIGAGPRATGAGGHRDESALIGSVQAAALATGFLFVSLYRGNLNGLTGLLFGSFLGITRGQVAVLFVVGIVALLLLGFMARPLLLASVDPEVAAALGVPVGPIGVAFLLLLAVAVAETSQITGSLLVFALLVLPPATAQAITGRPVVGLAIAVGLAVAVTWVSLTIAFYTPYPTGAFVTSIAFGAYVAARVVRFARERPRRAYA